MKAPNGYGAVYRLNGRRRKPWTVRITTGYKVNEKGSRTPIVKYIGYYETKAEAFKARDEYNRIEHKTAPTFGEVLEDWKQKHYPDISEGTQAVYNSAIKAMSPLFSSDVACITFSGLQGYVDSLNTNAVQARARTVLKQVFEYARQQGYIDVNPADGLQVKKAEKPTKHYRFTDDEIEVLWQHKGDFVADFCLVTIYTGLRPGELRELTEFSGDFIYIRQGKTKNAVRAVPVHEKIKPILESRKENLFRTSRAFSVAFEKGLRDYGILEYIHPQTGLKQAHKPHDGRHTFTSKWKVQGLNESMRRYIQGHAGDGIAEQVYLHFTNDELLAEVNKLK